MMIRSALITLMTFLAAATPVAAGKVPEARSSLIELRDAQGNRYMIANRFNGTDFDITVFKNAPGGGMLWTDTHDAGEDETAYGAVVDNNGHLLIVGSARNEGGSRFLVLGFSPTGTMTFNNTYQAHNKDTAVLASAGPKGSFFIAGYTFNGSSYDGWVARIDHGGTLLWEHGFDSGANDFPEHILSLPGGHVQFTLESQQDDGSRRTARIHNILFADNGRRTS